MSKNILVPLAKGFEEAEFVGIVDPLRRAGLNVIIASLDSELIVSSGNSVKVVADVTLCSVDINSLEAIVLPGGIEGMENLKNSDKVIDIIKKLHSENKLVAAICASSVVLHKAGAIEGNFTCYPGFEKGLNNCTRVHEAFYINKNIITGAGPAVALLFGLEIVKYLCGDELYSGLYEGLLFPLNKA